MVTKSLLARLPTDKGLNRIPEQVNRAANILFYVLKILRYQRSPRLIGFNISAAIQTHEQSADPVVLWAEARLVENERARGTQTSSREVQYFPDLLVGEMMKYAKRKKHVCILRQLSDLRAAGVSTEKF
jgi:hypothetical protein